MRLMMWHKGGKHVHTHGRGSKRNNIDTSAHRLIFYDASGSTVYDTQADKWYRDGQPFTPTFPLSFSLEDGRTVIADVKGTGGKVQWQIQ